MEDFLERFAQVNEAGEREFTVVREGLIVALLSVSLEEFWREVWITVG
jgi:hypothetical protein